MHWTDTWHEHTCPQCFRAWTCGRVKCDPKYKRFCPYGELCHVNADGSWKVMPETIRKGRGVGPLFDPKDIPVVSPFKKGDQGKPKVSEEALDSD